MSIGSRTIAAKIVDELVDWVDISVICEGEKRRSQRCVSLEITIAEIIEDGRR